MERRNFLKNSLFLSLASFMPFSLLSQKTDVKESGFLKSLKEPGTRILELEGWNVWCCSPIYSEDGLVHVFFSRWRGGHDNWLKESEIAHAVAENPEGPYEVLGTVLKGQGPGHWDADTIHNPTIHKVGDQYLLYYIGNNLKTANKNHAHHASTQRIGLAVSNSLNGPWKRVGNDGMILDTSKNKNDWDSYLTTNPALLHHPDGQLWLYYKAWDFNNDNLRKIGVAFADKPEGPYLKYKHNPVVSFSSINAQVEDAYVWFQNGKFHMIMRDMGVYSERSGLYLYSDDGLNWSEPMLAYRESTYYFPDEPLHRFERPQLLFRNGKATHLFLALMGGKYNKASGAVLKIDSSVF
ncbi:MAG: glycoside hydrolase family protein [Mangrovibacterium sp.]